ncbi:MAG: hypothetical protein M1816_005839 [Peltula sp. TS41687]|nr:MAG: hypothetical protein M1816_005839 [Peltula sp. TS41687]
MSTPPTTGSTEPGQSALPSTDEVLAGLMEDLGQHRRLNLPLEGRRVHVDLARLDATRRAHHLGTMEWQKTKDDAPIINAWQTWAKKNDDGTEDHGQSHRVKLINTVRPIGINPGRRDPGNFPNGNKVVFNLAPTPPTFAASGSFPADDSVTAGRMGGQRVEQVQRGGQGRRGRGGGFIGRQSPTRVSAARALAEDLNITTTRDHMRMPQRATMAPGTSVSPTREPTNKYRPGLSYDDPRSVFDLEFQGISNMGPPPEPKRRTSTGSGRWTRVRSAVSSRASSMARTIETAPPSRRTSLAPPDVFMKFTAQVFPAAQGPTIANAGTPTATTSLPVVAAKAQSASSDTVEAPSEPVSKNQSVTTEKDKVDTDQVPLSVQPSVPDENKAALERGPTSDETKVAPQGGDEGSQPTTEHLSRPLVASIKDSITSEVMAQPIGKEDEMSTSPSVLGTLLDFNATEVAQPTGRASVSELMRMFGIDTATDLEVFNFGFRYPVNETVKPKKDGHKEDDKENIISITKTKESHSDSDGDLLSFSDDEDTVSPLKPAPSPTYVVRDLWDLPAIPRMNARFAAIGLNREAGVEGAFKAIDINAGATKQPLTHDQQVSAVLAKYLDPKPPKVDFEDAFKVDTKPEATEEPAKLEQQVSTVPTRSLEPKPSEVAETTINSSILHGGLSASRFADDSAAFPPAQQQTKGPSTVFGHGTEPAQQQTKEASTVFGHGTEPSSPPLLKSENSPPKEKSASPLKAFSGSLGGSRWAAEDDEPIPKRRVFVKPRVPAPVPQGPAGIHMVGYVTSVVSVMSGPAVGPVVGGGATTHFSQGGQAPANNAYPRIHKPVTIRNPRTGEIIHRGPPKEKNDDDTKKSKWASGPHTQFR